MSVNACRTPPKPSAGASSPRRKCPPRRSTANSVRPASAWAARPAEGPASAPRAPVNVRHDIGDVPAERPIWRIHGQPATAAAAISPPCWRLRAGAFTAPEMDKSLRRRGPPPGRGKACGMMCANVERDANGKRSAESMTANKTIRLDACTRQDSCFPNGADRKRANSRSDVWRLRASQHRLDALRQFVPFAPRRGPSDPRPSPDSRSPVRLGDHAGGGIAPRFAAGQWHPNRSPNGGRAVAAGQRRRQLEVPAGRTTSFRAPLCLCRCTGPSGCHFATWSLRASRSPDLRKACVVPRPPDGSAEAGPRTPSRSAGVASAHGARTPSNADVRRFATCRLKGGDCLGCGWRARAHAPPAIRRSALALPLGLRGGKSGGDVARKLVSSLPRRHLRNQKLNQERKVK